MSFKGKHHSDASKKKISENSARIWLGRHHSDATKKKMSISHSDEKNINWKGDSVGRCGVHHWIWRKKPKPKLCEICKKKPPRDLANISGEYKRDVNDYEWLCRRCHMICDGRIRANVLESKNKN